MARRCTCGFTNFHRVQGSIRQGEVDLWMASNFGVIPGGAAAGHGTTPEGTVHGAGQDPDDPGDVWALVRSPVYARTRDYRCENCDRVRSQTPIGGTALVGYFYERNDEAYYFIVSTTEDLGNFQARIKGVSVVFDQVVSLMVGSTTVPHSATPANLVLQTQLDEPVGQPIAVDLFMADLQPLSLSSGETYAACFIDISRGTETFAGNFVYLTPDS